jgi:hypothetical protein
LHVHCTHANCATACQCRNGHQKLDMVATQDKGKHGSNKSQTRQVKCTRLLLRRNVSTRLVWRNMRGAATQSHKSSTAQKCAAQQLNRTRVALRRAKHIAFGPQLCVATAAHPLVLRSIAGSIVDILVVVAPVYSQNSPNSGAVSKLHHQFHCNFTAAVPSLSNAI